MDTLPPVQTIPEELQQAWAELYQERDLLRHATSVDEQIEHRLNIGKCTQRIRRLERERREGY